MMNIDRLDEKTFSILKSNGFDTIPFEALLQKLKREGVNPGSNIVKGLVEPLPEEMLLQIPNGEDERQRLAAIGEAAIEAGEVGVIVLNGGMATRFGNRAKGVAEAVDGRSFLDLKLSQIQNAGKGRVVAFLMNSFATEEVTKNHLRTVDLDLEVRHFNQMASLRVTPEGELFVGEDGRPSIYTPGHGDLPYALRQSGELSRFLDRGGRYLMVSNVDNLAAGLDPLIIGIHASRAHPMTVELVPTRLGDIGGFPALLDGRPVIVESFRIPELFDISAVSRFNTNSFVFDARVFSIDLDLEWFVVLKRVNGSAVIQFERLVGQLTELMEATWLEVPRDGPNSRFIPIKEPIDLDRKAASLRSVLANQGVL
jgi:UTP--glucose-1-phosphate uridylyltransferase